ncbi:MAG: hypothetical protein GXP14_08000 [Gammaproteobacteria bacterium]|nr:hypothetical protein [Gammaproteobacteria bacterium]
MTMTKYLFIFLATLSVSVVAEQPAGILEQVTGTVLIDRGDGFVTASSGYPVLEGDRLLLLENAKAVLIQQHGCFYRMQENSLLIAQKANPSLCSKVMQIVSGAVFAQAIGLEEEEILDDAGEPGFGAIGSESPIETVPSVDANQDLQISEEPQPANQGTSDPEPETEEVASEAPVLVDELDETDVVSTTPTKPPMMGLSKKALGGILGGAGVLVLALAGGGGGGGGENPPPSVSPE